MVEDQEMIDIVFINPSNSASLYQGLATKLAAVEPPTWALLLAESVRSQGYSTKIIDANAEGISDDELVKRVSEYSPRLICIVVYGQNVNAGTAGMSGASRVAKALKASNNKLRVTLIGSYVQALPIKTLYFHTASLLGHGPAPVVACGCSTVRTRVERCCIS